VIFLAIFSPLIILIIGFYLSSFLSELQGYLKKDGDPGRT
jgi:hypothetical protein